MIVPSLPDNKVFKFKNVRRGNSEYFKNDFNQRIIDIPQKFSKELQLTYQALKKK